MIARNDPFICENCHQSVEPIKFGGSYRNHCPYCLFSKHIDGSVPGDRSESCRGLMEPIGVTTKSGGEFTIIHRCQKCGFERKNRIAGDDNINLITKISGLAVK